MKVNLVHSSTSSEERQKLVYWLASEMSKEYNIGPEGVRYFAHTGGEELCKWIKKTYNINVSKFLFEDDGYIVGAGFDFEDGPELIALLLKIPGGSLDLS